MTAAADEAGININFLAIIPIIGVSTCMTSYQIIGFLTASLVHKYSDPNGPDLL